MMEINKMNYDVWRELELFKKMHSEDNAYVNIYKGIREVIKIIDNYNANGKQLILTYLDALLHCEPEEIEKKDEYLKEFLKRFDSTEEDDEQTKAIKDRFKIDMTEVYAVVTNIEKNRDVVIKYIKMGAYGRPLTPLTDDEDEWTRYETDNNDEVYINNRYKAVVKVNGDVFWNMAELRTEDGGKTWALTENSTECIELPSMIPETRLLYYNPETNGTRTEYGDIIVGYDIDEEEEGDGKGDA